MRKSITLAALAGLMGTATLAATPPAEKLQGLSTCRALTDDHARLSCYDAEVTHLFSAVNTHEVVVLDREDMQSTRRGLFGFTLPKMSLFGKNGSDSPRDEVAEIDAVVKTATSLGYGKWRLRLDDGALWETTDAVDWNEPHPGSKIHIKRGAFGSYFMTIDGSTAIRAMRNG